VRERGEDAVRLGVYDVSFVDPPGTRPGEGSAPAGLRLQPPRYPMDQARAGVGATVTLLLRLDADGIPVEVGAERVWLIGTRVGGERQQRLHADALARAAENAARDWRFSAGEGGVVRVPVKFHPPGYVSDRWSQTHPIARELPAWIRT